MIPSAETTGHSPRPGTWLVAGLLGAAVAAAYANSFAGAFQFDDIPAILENPTLQPGAGLVRLLLLPGDQAGTVGGRPLVNLSLALNHLLGGTRPWGYHLFNLLIHLGGALLLYAIIRRTLRPGDVTQPAAGPGKTTSRWGQNRWSGPDAALLAFFSALVWAVHPLQTEAVTYIVQRAESLMGLCFLLTVYAFIRYAEVKGAGNGKQLGWAGLAILSCFLGMTAKEVMVVAPLVVLVYDRTFVSGTLREAWRRHRGLHLGLGATWLPLAVLVTGTHGRGGSAGDMTAAGVWPYLLTQCQAIIHYLRLAFWPDRLVFDYGTALIRDPRDVLVEGAAVVLLLGGVLCALRWRPAIGFAGLWFFLVLAPSSSFVPITTEPVAEHRMYLPLAAVVVLALAALFTLLLRGTPRCARTVFCGLGLVVAVGLGATTVRRNRDYGSEIALWSDTVGKRPGNPRAHNNLAEAFRAAGEPARAAAEFATAVEVDPDYAPAQYNLGVTLLDSGRPGEAIPHLEKALAAPRHQAELQQYLGEACARLGRHTAAIEHYRRSLRLGSGNVAAEVGLGNALASLGNYAAAVEVFRRAVALAPDQSSLRNDLATALLCAGRREEAIAEYRETLRRDPGNRWARENLEQVLTQIQGAGHP